MGKKLNVQNRAIEVLKGGLDERFTAMEIATEIFKRYPDACREKQESSTATVTPLDNDGALISQIAAEIGSKRKYMQGKWPQLKVTDGRPKKYYYAKSPKSERTEQGENAPTTSPVKGITEDELYPILSEFLKSEFELKIYSKRIDEKRSSNRQKGGNKWLHPDIVAIEILSQNWDSEITKCVGEHGDKKAKLWSFEVKVKLGPSDLREAFFQAVSNSSWANYGYLVVSEIDDKVSNEIRILSSLHGIGLIVLDTDNPSEGRIAIPAKEKPDIDWNAANRLAQVNNDFKGYIKLVTDFYKINRISENDWE